MFPEVETEAGKASLVLLDGASAFASYIERECGGGMDYADKQGKRWAGGTVAQMLTWARRGNLDLVPRSDALLDRLEALESPARNAFEVWNMPAGGVPNVPAFLSGRPDAMRLRRRVVKQQAPIVVLSDNFAHAGIDAENIRRRGAAVLALVRSLTSLRPVTLYSTIGLSGAGKTLVGGFRVETAPLDLARAAWALGDPTVLRHGWHLIYGKINGRKYAGGYHVDAPAAIAKHLGFEDHITVPRVGGNEWKTDADAARWVADTMRETFEADPLAA